MKAFSTVLAILLCSGFSNVSFASTSPEVKARIERVMAGLLPETAIANRFGDPARLLSRMDHFNTPGVSIAVINNGQLEWALGFGVKEYGRKDPVTEHTLFQAASISKAVFAVAVMRLVQDGTLNLDSDVNTYLKGWQIPKAGDWQPRITLRQLLSHSAGLRQHMGFPGYARDQKLPTIVDILRGQAPANSQPVEVNILPGTQMRYSGGGTTVAEKVVIDVVEKPFPAIMSELVLARVGMSESTFEQPLPKKLEKAAATAHQLNNVPVQGKWHVYPEHAAAGLWTTPTDLAKLGVELQRALDKKSERMLNHASVTQMLTSEVSDAMGIGFFLRGDGEHIRFEHPGGNQGFRAKSTFYKRGGLGAVIMINSNESDLIGEIERAIAKEYAWPGYFVDDKPSVKLTEHEAQRLAGVYTTAKGAIYEVTRDDGRLFLKLAQQSPIELAAESKTKFFVRFLDTTLRFEKDALIIEQDGNVTTAQKRHKKK